VVPVLPGGCSTHHLGFAGTVDLPPSVVAGYVDAYLSMLGALGVADAFLFSAHGGNFGLMASLAARPSVPGGPRLHAFSSLGPYMDAMIAGAARVGLTVPATDAHAGGLETSQMRFLRGVEVPEGLVGYVADEVDWMERLMAEGMPAVSANGVLGAPAGATAAAGAAICTSLAETLAGWVEAELAGGATTVRPS